MECPECKGKKEIVGLFAIRSDGSGCDPCRMFPCHRCKGAGSVPDEMAEWMEAGKRLKEDRLARNMTLRQEAEARELRVSELSDMERGRVDPDNPPKPTT